MSEIVLSGIRATGRLHFGNFVGAVSNFAKLQVPDNTCLFFIADWHTLTTMEDPEALRSNLLEIIKDYLAAGLDPEQSVLYAQSSVPELAELFLYLGMFQSLGELQRIPTFKEKVRKQPDRVTHGLLSYPVLMAADILGPGATLVPVGEDQVPNVELARNLAEAANRYYGEDIFVLPKMLTQMVKVPGLDGGKMGKSEGETAVSIMASRDEVFQLYRERGITDESRLRPTDPGDPYHACKSVFPLHELVTAEETIKSIAARCRAGEIGCVECKGVLADSIAAILEPFQERRAALANQDDYAADVLREGGIKARERITPTVDVLRDRMGIGPR